MQTQNYIKICRATGWNTYLLFINNYFPEIPVFARRCKLQALEPRSAKSLPKSTQSLSGHAWPWNGPRTPSPWGGGSRPHGPLRPDDRFRAAWPDAWGPSPGPGPGAGRAEEPAELDFKEIPKWGLGYKIPKNLGYKIPKTTLCPDASGFWALPPKAARPKTHVSGKCVFLLAFAPQASQKSVAKKPLRDPFEYFQSRCRKIPAGPTPGEGLSAPGPRPAGPSRHGNCAVGYM